MTEFLVRAESCAGSMDGETVTVTTDLDEAMRVARSGDAFGLDGVVMGVYELVPIEEAK